MQGLKPDDQWFFDLDLCLVLLIFFTDLGGGFKHFLFSPRNSGKISNLTNMFQMSWNHQPVILYMVKSTIVSMGEYIQMASCFQTFDSNQIQVGLSRKFEGVRIASRGWFQFEAITNTNVISNNLVKL